MQALSIQRGDPYALVARSKCQLKQGNLQAALNDVNIILKEDPNDFKVPTLNNLTFCFQLFMSQIKVNQEVNHGIRHYDWLIAAWFTFYY